MDLTIEEIAPILENYDLGSPLSLSRLRSGFANENYHLITDVGEALFRVCREKSKEEIQYELRVLQRLKKEAFPAAYPIQRRNGSFISRLKENVIVASEMKSVKEGNDCVLLMDFIAGGEPKQNPETVREIARATARLNSIEVNSDLRRANALGPDLCHEIMMKLDAGDHTFSYPEIFNYFREETERLIEPLSKELPTGLIHGDIFPDNTIFQGDRLKAIVDFEEVCTDSLLVDVGVTINGFCFPDDRLDENLLDIFLKTYQEIRPLSSLEWKLLPYYIEWGAHAMIAWHLKYLLDEQDSRKMGRLQFFMKRVKELRKKDVRFHD